MNGIIKYVETFMKNVVAAGPNDSLAAIARLMEQHNVGAVVIVENHRPVGIVTDRDLALELGARGASPQTPAVRVMSTPVEIIHQDEKVFGATQTMRDLNVRRLVVVDEDGLLCGMVTVDDLLQLLARELANLAEGIRPEMKTKEVKVL